MNVNVKYAFLSFLITFAIAFPISTIILTNIQNASLEETQTDYQTNKTEYVIPKEQDINLLFILDNKNQSSSDVFSLIKLSPHDNTVSLTVIDQNVTTTVGVKTASLNQFLETSGNNTAKQAIENLMNISADRFISTDDNGAAELINYLSGVEITLNEDITYSNITLNKGRQLLDGSRFVALLHAKPQEALCAVSRAFYRLNNLDGFYKKLSDVSATDFTAYDYEIYKYGFMQMIKNNNASFNIVNLEFETVNNRNKLTEKSRSECEKYFYSSK